MSIPQETVSKEPIAIVGLGCVLPDAPDVATFWSNLLEGRSSIREVPKQRWDPELFWSPDKEAEERTYSKLGAFVADDAFNGLDYRLPPKTVEQIDPSQRWALSATRQAFLDAGYRTGIKADEAKGGRDFDRGRCAVILGNAMGGEQMKLQAKNLYWPQVERALRTDPDFQGLPSEKQEAVLRRAKEKYQAGTPPVTEDSMPGALSNVAAGRIANAFDLAGKNFTTDAACASSLAALDAAIDTLRKGECDMVVWGGTDRSMDITPYVEFSRIGALSPDGSRPFDKEANGFVMGEGCVVLLLKRLSDAERDGDKVYAVVRGIGGSSDGKGKGITAPNPAGQVKAVVRAYQDAAVDPFTIGYLEAHGTSTPVGDPVELQSAEEAFRSLGGAPAGPGTILVGSVKSNMGHLKSAAGAVGLLKATLALQHGVVPPSINVRTLNPRIEWARSPFRVVTERTPWPRPEGRPRRAAVSSFGFGGTNFHVIVEEYVPGRLVHRPAVAAVAQTVQAPGAAGGRLDADAFQRHMKQNAELEAEPLVLDGATAAQAVAALPAGIRFPETEAPPRLRDLFVPLTRQGLAADMRLGIAPMSLEEIPKKLDLAKKAMGSMAAARLAFAQGVFLGKGRPQGKVAFLFPGQGTQYVNMLRDLAQKYEVVRTTFHEADAHLRDDLGGVRLTDILWPEPDTPEARKAAEEKLKLTEFTQPAVLAADVALLRLLKQWGIEPDVVAGHSLGEYGALVAAGVLSFADALHAVAARGREMANVDVPDLGKMAAVPADWATVQKAIEGVPGYVIPANKNCPSQTVLAGSSPGVDAAVQILQAQGLQAQFLPVSAAFHSDIVAPASAPLRRVLERLDVQAPKVRVLSNVGAEPYPDDPTQIRDNLARQIAHPVEWIEIVQRMYDEGVRVFVEVGPKKALTGFVQDILKEKPDAVAVCSNHPKKGGIAHVNELYAFLGAWGFRPALPDLDDPAVYTAGFRDPTAQFRQAAPAASPASVPAATPASALRAASLPAAPAAAPDPRLDVIAEGLRRLVDELEGMRSPPRAATAAPATTTALPATAAAAPATTTAAPTTSATPAADEAERLRRRVAAFGLNLDDVGVSGISVGLPGAHKPLFDEKDWDRILAGENLIDPLPEKEREKLADKNIVRLVKGTGGEARFQAIDDVAQVIRLAGLRGGFDITEWGVDGDLASVLDRTFQYAIAAGIEALRDAGIPLQRTYVQTSTGSYLPKEWKLPEPLRDETGIVFASAFPGYDNLVREIGAYLADKYAGRSLDELQRLYDELIAAISDEDLRGRVRDAFDVEFERLQSALPDHGAARYEFNRKFLFNVLSMGHAQLAQFIGARGPNTQVNAACSSTTQAIAVAEDWIRTGRCRRVIVVGADDVTSDAMFEWIGAGFLASGAATTKERVEDAALPFDRRRHGMIVGMGAVGLVVEAVPETEKRGMRPIARLLATRVANSAYHGSRLDVQHIAGEMQALLRTAQARYGVAPNEIAAQTVFMSHETYTPARGGSASAEIHALRAAFGERANRVVVANTKGFTGHPQGAGIEDAIVLKCLQRGRVPPIANFKEPDPELGDLNLSRGGPVDVRYALRLAAGFGSQVAMTLTELVAREDERVADPARHAAWLEQVTGLPAARTEVVNRTLRVVDQGPPTARARTVAEPASAASSAPLVAAPAAAPSAAGPAASAASTASAASRTASADEVLERLLGLVVERTGYPRELLDPDLDLEADLGIDTVKQAELFGLLREHYGLPLEEGLQIKDYPSLRKVAGYFAVRVGGAASAPAAAAATAAASVTSATAASSAPAAGGTAAASPAAASGDDVLARLVALVAERTGYPLDLLDPDLDMEADLGIDTVKQAELFGLMRETYGLPLEEGLQIKDYPSLRKVAGYFAVRAGASAVPAAPHAAAPHTAAPHVAAPHAAPSATPAPASVGPSPGAAEDVLDRLTSLVAERTGYPREMLEPDLDLEADLGIDTVKQAELFGLLREHYGLPLEEGLQIKDYPTLRRLAGYFADRVGGTSAGVSVASVAPPAAQASASAGPAAAASPPAPAAGADPAAILAKVTELVAQKTGYPAGMLEPDLDMEADLGIDTVKQAELIGQVRETFGIPLVEGLQIKDYPTLRRVAEFVVQHSAPASATVLAVARATPAGAVPSAAAAAAAARAAVPAAPATQASSGILRRVPVPRAEPRPGSGPALARGPIVVVGDPQDAFLDAFKAAGFEPRFRLEGPAPVGLLCIATRPAPDDAKARLGSLFDAAKALRTQLGEDAFACVVTAQDGAHGLHGVRDPGMAGLAGLAKALRKELKCLVKAVDLHPACPNGPKQVVEELLHGGARTEVAYAEDGTRHVVDVAPEALPESVPDVAGRHLVVSGGAQGITVELLAALAPQGPRLTLLGRTRLPPEAAAWAALDEAGWKREEQAAMDRLKAEGARVTPMAIKKAVEPMRKAAEVHRNLDRLRAAGAEVRYEALDVTDAAAVAAAVAAARDAFGPVEGLVHAAGVEISKDLSEKDRTQFDTVVGVKLDGWQALVAAAGDDPVRWLVGFGSVAGRFGNVGQVDYSAANEWLAKAVKAEAARRGAATAFTVAWGPWGEVGMATRGSILQIMESSGVTPIPTREGVAHFLRELAAPGVRESVVAGTLGMIDVDGQAVAPSVPVPAAAEAPATSTPSAAPTAATAPTASTASTDLTAPATPAPDDPALAPVRAALRERAEENRLLSDVTAFEAGHSVRATVVVDRARDPYLDDHAIDGVPVFPGVFGVEAFAQAAHLLVPDLALLGAEDVRFASPLKQLKDRPVEAEVACSVVSAEEEPETRVQCRLTTRFVAPDGRTYGEPRLHFEATLRFGAAVEAPRGQPPECDGRLRRADIYPPFFHGPSFQVLRAAGPFGERAVAQFRAPLEPHFGAGPARFLTAPMVNEALFQVCGLRTLEEEHAMSLPFALERLELFDAAAAEGLVLWCEPRGRTSDGHRRFDAVAATRDGTVVARMVGYAMIETGQVPPRVAGQTEDMVRVARAPAAAPVAPEPGPLAVPVVPAAARVPDDAIREVALPLPALENVLFAAVPVEADAPAQERWFTAAERAEHAALAAPKRRDEWRAGRLAAKAAAMKASPGLGATEVEVRHDAKQGFPVLWVQGRPIDVPVTITHRDGIAVAAVAESALGIDLETVEARPDAWRREAFNDDELAVLAQSGQADLEAACMWAAKEAAFKRARTGLRTSLHAHTVRPDGRGGAVVAGPLGTFGVHFFDLEGRVLAVSHPAYDPPGASTAEPPASRSR